MTEFEWVAKDEADTERLGLILADALPDGTVVALNGTLGAGKTRLVQAIAGGCGVDREMVVSPTFVLWQTYPGRRTIHHLDAYRIRDDDEFLELGIVESFGSPGLVLIEWAERVRRCLPDELVEVQIDVEGESSRRFRVRVPNRPQFAELVVRLRK